MEDDMSIGNALEFCLSERIEGPMAVVVDKSLKSFSCNDGEEHEEQVGDHLIANEVAIKIPMENDDNAERFPEG